MNPTEFNESNLKLIGRRMGTDAIKPLPGYSDGELIMSCWKMNFKDRIRALLFGTIWLQVKAQDTHPPVTMFCNKYGFEMKWSKKKLLRYKVAK